MNIRKWGIYWRSFPAILLLICCFLVIGAGSRPEDPSAELRTGVISILPELKIIELKHLDNYTFEVTMKNGFDKDITAIAASDGNGTVFLRNYLSAEFESDQKLAPGATDVFLYRCNPALGERVDVRTVLFSDMTSKGDPRDVREILDQRLGMKIQFGRIKHSLERLEKVGPSFIRGELSNLRRIAESLPLEKDDRSAMSSALEFGLRQGRSFILKQLSEMETELETDRIETFYQNGQPQTIRHTGYENFRKRFERIQKYVVSVQSTDYFARATSISWV